MAFCWSSRKLYIREMLIKLETPRYQKNVRGNDEVFHLN